MKPLSGESDQFKNWTTYYLPCSYSISQLSLFKKNIFFHFYNYFLWKQKKYFFVVNDEIFNTYFIYLPAKKYPNLEGKIVLFFIFSRHHNSFWLNPDD